MHLKAKYTWNDKGWRELTSNVARAGATKLRVGVLGADASRKHPNADITIGEVALINEFGSDDGHVPRRSFIRGTVNGKMGLMASILNTAARAVVMAKQSADVALGHAGALVVNAIRETIEHSIAPHNAKATVDKKGFDHPLIESGVLKEAISFQLVKTSGVTDKGAVGGDYEAFSVGFDD